MSGGRIYPQAIQSHFVRGGAVYQNALKVSNDVRTAARRNAHSRSGRLRRSISAERHTLPLGVKFTVTAYAPYALFVELGTAGAGAGTIPTKKHLALMTLYAGDRVVPGRYAAYKGAFAYEVQGQKPQLFLSKGLAIGLAKNGLI